MIGNQTKTREDSSLCPGTSTKNFVQELHLCYPSASSSFLSVLLFLLSPAALFPSAYSSLFLLLSFFSFPYSAARTAFLPPPFSCSFTNIASPLFFLLHIQPFFPLSPVPFHLNRSFSSTLPLFSSLLAFAFYLLFFVYFDFFSVLNSKFSSLFLAFVWSIQHYF
jgi:hypothetical protein